MHCTNTSFSFLLLIHFRIPLFCTWPYLLCDGAHGGGWASGAEPIHDRQRCQTFAARAGIFRPMHPVLVCYLVRVSTRAGLGWDDRPWFDMHFDTQPAILDTQIFPTHLQRFFQKSLNPVFWRYCSVCSVRVAYANKCLGMCIFVVCAHPLPVCCRTQLCKQSARMATSSIICFPTLMSKILFIECLCVFLCDESMCALNSCIMQGTQSDRRKWWRGTISKTRELS